MLLFLPPWEWALSCFDVINDNLPNIARILIMSFIIIQCQTSLCKSQRVWTKNCSWHFQMECQQLIFSAIINSYSCLYIFCYPFISLIYYNYILVTSQQHGKTWGCCHSNAGTNIKKEKGPQLFMLSLSNKCTMCVFKLMNQ